MYTKDENFYEKNNRDPICAITVHICMAGGK